MKFKKILQVISSLALLTPVISLTTACQQASDKKDITFLNPNIAKALKLYDQQGNSLIKQYLFRQYDKDNVAKYRIQVGTRCLDFNSFPDFKLNKLLNLTDEDFIKYPELNEFLTNTLKMTKDGRYDWSLSDLIKIIVVTESYIVPNDISLQYNESKSIIDFQAPAITCNIEFYNSDTNEVLVKYKVNVASSFLNIANQKSILIDKLDISYDLTNFHNLNIIEKGKSFNSIIHLKDDKWSLDTVDTIDLAKIIHAKINFKVYDIDQNNLVLDDEVLNNTSSYAIAFTLNGVYINTIFRVGQRTDS